MATLNLLFTKSYLYYFILLSSKNSTIPFIAQTIPAVYIPSKNIAGIQLMSNILVDSPPKTNDKKNYDSITEYLETYKQMENIIKELTNTGI